MRTSTWMAVTIAGVFATACSSSHKTAKTGMSDASVTADAGKMTGASACSVHVAPGKDDQTALQGALIDAKEGDTVCLAAGRFKLTGQLSLATAKVTVRGDKATILDFSGQTSGANGVEITADHDTLDTLRLEDVQGDGVRATEVSYVTIRGIHVEWTNGPSSSNGGYGIYPVTSSHILIEDCYASGASDTGIYVGQSSTIVVRNNETTGNVAGIELENSTDAEVFGNTSHDNTAGILVFNLPGLAVKDGKRIDVHDNVVTSNNLANFAAAGNIVHDVPQGTGMFVLASDDNEIHHNTVQHNDSIGLAILSWYVALRDQEGMADPKFDWYPERNYVHDNSFTDNGQMLHDNAATIAAVVGATKGADMQWDGIVDWAKVDGDAGAPDVGAGMLPAVPMELANCFEHNGDATFLNLDLDHNGKDKTSDVTAYTCTRESLPQVMP
ncbi:MAG: parallel beta-helix domain-containing protein [Polyangiales bacterium]